MPAVAVEPHVPGDRRFLREILELGVRASYPDLEKLGRLSAQERLDEIFDDCWVKTEKHIWVARDGALPVGAIWLERSIHPVTDIPDHLIVVMAVLASHRGRGIARRLSEIAQAYVVTTGVPRLRMFTAASNVATRTLYSSLGYGEGMVEMSWEAP